MNTKELIAAILGGLAVLIVSLAILWFTFGQMFYTAKDNNDKVQYLVEYCVAQGFDGFIEDMATDGEHGFRCYNEGEK